MKYSDWLKVSTGTWLLLGLLMVLGLSSVLRAQEFSEGDRLNRYARLSQVDPLYAWPAVDLDAMRLSVDALQASRAEILSVAKLQYSEDQQNRIETSLYPTEYLGEMIGLESQRRTLSEEVTPEELQAYQEQLLRTIKAHRAYLIGLRAALQKTANEQSYKGLEFHFGRSSFAHFMAGIEAYREENERARLMAERRWRCIEVETENCEHAVMNVVPKAELSELSADLFDSTPARITKAIREGGQLGGQGAGPGWALLDLSDCYIEEGPIPFLIWEFPTASGVPIFRPEVVSDVLVHDHQIKKDSNSYERILRSFGMEGFLFQPHTNLYACPDAAGDSARLRTMVFVYDLAMQLDWAPPMAGNAQMSEAFVQLSTAAETLKRAEILREQDVQNLMHFATGLLSEFKRNELVAELGEARVNSLETAALAYRLQTPFLSRDVMNLAYGNTAIADYALMAPWGFLEELMFTRNGPELLLGGTNLSIVSANYPQVERQRSGVSPRLRSYVHDLSKEYDPETMVDILLKGLEAEYWLAQLQDRPYLFAK